MVVPQAWMWCVVASLLNFLRRLLFSLRWYLDHYSKDQLFWWQRIREHVHRRNFAGAHSIAMVALTHYPRSLFLLNEFGSIETHLGHFAEAEAAFHRATEGGVSLATLEHLATLYLISTRFDDAVSCIQKGIDLETFATQTESRRSFSWLLLGQAYRSRGDLSDAIRSLMKAVSIHPMNLRARIELGLIYEAQLEWRQAHDQFQFVSEQEEFAEIPGARDLLLLGGLRIMALEGLIRVRSTPQSGELYCPTAVDSLKAQAQFVKSRYTNHPPVGWTESWIQAGSGTE